MLERTEKMEVISHKLEHCTAYIQTWTETIDLQLCECGKTA